MELQIFRIRKVAGLKGGGGEKWNSDILKRRIYKSGGTGDIQLSISPTGKGMQTGVDGPRGQDQGRGELLGFGNTYLCTRRSNNCKNETILSHFS
jgi:hypothetical protein